eukprot:452137-Amphidinium_carterae.1
MDHSISVEQRASTTSIVLYSPARAVASSFTRVLGMLGFPHHMERAHDYPPAQTFATTTDESQTEDDEQETLTAVVPTLAPTLTPPRERERSLSPTLPWTEDDDLLLAGANNEEVFKEDVAKLVQWAKGMPSGHTPRQLRVILISEKRTCRRLHDCRIAADKEKAQNIIAAAMKRCGMQSTRAPPTAPPG